MAALELPSGSSYMCSILISLLPKSAVIVSYSIITNVTIASYACHVADMCSMCRLLCGYTGMDGCSMSICITNNGIESQKSWRA